MTHRIVPHRIGYLVQRRVFFWWRTVLDEDGLPMVFRTLNAAAAWCDQYRVL